MYIGPWQEYNLFKSRPAVATKKNQDALREDIEKAILSSLDPESAQKALEAMHPLLDRLPNNSSLNRNLNSSLNLNNQNRENLTIRTSQTNSNNILPLRLPYISKHANSNNSNMSLSDRRQPSSKPVSAKSTRSEPIHQSNYMNPPKPSASSTSSHSSSINTRENDDDLLLPKLPRVKSKQANDQPAYNSSSVVAILKLERENRQDRNKFAKFWEWTTENKSNKLTMSDTLTDDGMSEKGLKKSARLIKKKSSNSTDQKLNHVKQMQQMYLNENNKELQNSHDIVETSIENNSGSQQFPNRNTNTMDNTNIKSITTINTDHNIYKHSNTDSHSHKPLTPKIGNIDITENELMAISKYFTQSTLAPDFDTGNNNSISISPSPIRISSSHKSSSMEKSIIIQQAAKNSLNQNFNQSSNFSRPPAQPPISNIHHSTNSREIGLSGEGPGPGLGANPGIMTVSSPKVGRRHFSPLSSPHSQKNHENFNNSKNYSDVDAEDMQERSYTAADELYLGGAIDGLINWSMNLDFDQY